MAIPKLKGSFSCIIYSTSPCFWEELVFIDGLRLTSKHEDICICLRNLSQCENAIWQKNLTVKETFEKDYSSASVERSSEESEQQLLF